MRPATRSAQDSARTVHIARSSHRRASVGAWIISATLTIAACNGDGSDGDAGDDLPFCETEGDPGGAWDPAVVDWSDPGAPGPDPQLLGECLDENDDPIVIVPHHQFLSPVHAIHMPTPPGGELLMYHGRSEERVWPIGTAASTMRRHPIPQCVPFTLNGETVVAYPDIFCSGHVLLATGNVLVAGGNITGSPGDGGLYEAFLFNPRTASDTEQPYGWARVGGETPEDMDVDRWYPTLTGLPDGRVLISGGASLVVGGQNTFEVFDPSATVGTQIDKLPSALDFDGQAAANMPTYPFMFVLPNGDIFYAGGEGASTGAFDGRVLVPSYDGPLTEWEWADYSADSTIAGGSAVMYLPGMVMKSGGIGGGYGSVANNVTEFIDLSESNSNSYGSAPSEFTRRAEAPGAMHRPRHFHGLTVLPDGRVLATGGNMRGNDAPGDSVNNPCDSGGQRILDIPCDNGCPSTCRDDGFCSLYSVVECATAGDCPGGGGATCTAGRCRKACTTDADCPEVEDEPEVCWQEPNCAEAEDTEMCSDDPIMRCYPGNNACFSTHEAEIWDPDCETWMEYDDQVHERMYHSVALLIPDGRVISAGGGHERSNLVDQDNAEYFEPVYGDGVGTRPLVEVADDDIDNSEDYTVHIPYAPGEVTVQLLNAQARNVHGVTLVRLGAVTHQFDQGQRYLPLNLYDHAENAPTMTVTGPEPFGGDSTESAVAPPGFYMMFIWGDQTPSLGQYVHLGDPAVSEIWTAPAASGLAGVETSCGAEPVGGACPSWAEEDNLIPLPEADGPAGPVEGWNVLVPAGLVQNSDAPTPVELEAVTARAIAACQAQWASEPWIAASCDGPGAFATPVRFVEGSNPALDLVLPDQQNGSGIFGTQTLTTCQLGLDCCNSFDERLCSSAPSRTTPADSQLGNGEEYRVALGSTTSKVEIVTSEGTYSGRLTGSIGYSFCTAGSASAPCPFYVGSFDALASSSITATMRCADNTTSRQTISNLVTKLAQPAFGIAAQGTSTTQKGFPPGALVLESAFDIGTSHYTTRRPNIANVIMNANGSTFSASNLTASLKVPCNNSTATITVRYTLTDPGSGSALGKPPAATINVPGTVTCGAPTTLAATVTDPDGDLDTVRWFVDGVLLAPSMSTMIFTTGHTLRVVARDQRGATTTKTKVVQCL